MITYNSKDYYALHNTFVLLPYIPRIELMFTLPERPSILSMLRLISITEEDLSYRDYFNWIKGSF